MAVLLGSCRRWRNRLWVVTRTRWRVEKLAFGTWGRDAACLRNVYENSTTTMPRVQPSKPCRHVATEKLTRSCSGSNLVEEASCKASAFGAGLEPGEECCSRRFPEQVERGEPLWLIKVSYNREM